MDADQLAVAAARMSSWTRGKARSVRNSVAAIGSTAACRRRSGRETIGIEIAGAGPPLRWRRAFSALTFVGYDFQPCSIEHAAAHSREHGVAANTRFQVVTAKEYPEKDFDLVGGSTACTTWPTPPERQRMFDNR
jgi:hypothetical protein